MPVFLPARPGMPMAECAARKQKNNPGWGIQTDHPLRERVRGYGLTTDRNPSPGLDDLPLFQRVELCIVVAEPRRKYFPGVLAEQRRGAGLLYRGLGEGCGIAHHR